MDDCKKFSTDNGLGATVTIQRNDQSFVLEIDDVPVFSGGIFGLFALSELFKVAWRGQVPDIHSSVHDPDTNGYQYFNPRTGEMLMNVTPDTRNAYFEAVRLGGEDGDIKQTGTT